MTTATVSHSRSRAGSGHRPAVDVFAEKLARGILGWTERRAERARTRPTAGDSQARARAERIRRTREQDAARVWSASPFGHR